MPGSYALNELTVIVVDRWCFSLPANDETEVIHMCACGRNKPAPPPPPPPPAEGD